MKVARVRPVKGTSFAENKEQAKQLRQDVILPALAAGETVTIDFTGVETSTQSFVHALISEAIRRHGEAAIPQLRFKAASPEVRQLVTTVVEYTLMAADAASDLRAGGDREDPADETRDE